MRKAFRRGVINDGACRLASHADVELIVDARFAEVFGTNGKVNVTELIRPGIPTD